MLSANVHNKLKTQEVRPGRARARRQRPRAAGRDGADRRDRRRLGAPGRLAGEGRPRGPGRHPHEGADRRGIRRGADDASRPTSTACSRPSPSPARSGPTRRRRRSSLRVPAERKPEQSRLEVRYSPTLAGALVDALPYLADYPYGCTEQTLNRFLPTVITQKVLINLGVDLKAIHDKHTNLNAQQIGDARERGEAVEGLRAQPGLRPGRGRQDGRAPASSAWPTCSSPTAAGAGSPASASTPRPTRRPWSSTACRSPAATT